MGTKEKLQHSTVKFILIDILWDILYWPVWWYSRGLIKAGNLALRQIVLQYHQLALGVWVRNIFVPMFGQYDWQGRIISFFIRLVQIIARCILLVIWMAIIAVLFLGWIILPLYIVLQISYNLKAMLP